MATQIKVRRDTAANWASANPIPAPGEPCYETDTGILKFGDGTTNYNSLSSISSGPGGSGGYTYIQSGTVDGAPVSPSVDETWFDLDTGITYLRYDDGSGAVWMQSGVSTSGLTGPIAVPGDIDATGTPSASTVLYGDGSWGVPPGAGSSVNAHYVIAASNAPAAIKAKADEVLDGTADQVQIQAALDLGYPVMLTQGLFVVSAPIQIPSLGVLRGVGWATTIRATSTVGSTGDGAIIVSKSNTAVAVTVADLSLDGAYQSCHGVYFRNTSIVAADPPATGADNYSVFKNLFIDACYNGSTPNSHTGFWVHSDTDGARSCLIDNIVTRQCGRGMHIQASDCFLSNIYINSEGDGLVVDGGNNRVINFKAFWCDTIGLDVRTTATRNTFVNCEIQDQTGIAYKLWGNDCIYSACFADWVSASRTGTNAFDIYMSRGTLDGLQVRFSGAGTTVDWAFNFNTSDHIHLTGHIGTAESSFDNGHFTGTVGDGCDIAITRVGDSVWTGPRTTTVTGTTYTIDRHDSERIQIFSNASLVTVTVPTNASDPIPVGHSFDLLSTGAGGLTLSTTGLTLVGSPNKTIAQGEAMVLTKLGTDTWSVVGGTSA